PRRFRWSSRRAPRPRNEPEMQIRRAASGDEEALAAIRRRAILTLTAPALSPEQGDAWASKIAADRITLALADHDVVVAVDAVPIGWVEVDGDRVAALYVSPPHARSGVGSQLLHHAEDAIRAAGHARVRLEASLNALPFYQRRGYRQSGERELDGSYPMTKDLTASGWPGRDAAQAITPDVRSRSISSSE